MYVKESLLQPIAQGLNVSELLQKTCLKIILCLSERRSTDGNISLFIIHMQTEDVRGDVSSDESERCARREKKWAANAFTCQRASETLQPAPHTWPACSRSNRQSFVSSEIKTDLHLREYKNAGRSTSREQMSNG